MPRRPNANFAFVDPAAIIVYAPRMSMRKTFPTGSLSYTSRSPRLKDAPLPPIPCILTLARKSRCAVQRLLGNSYFFPLTLEPILDITSVILILMVGQARWVFFVARIIKLTSRLKNVVSRQFYKLSGEEKSFWKQFKKLRL